MDFLHKEARTAVFIDGPNLYSSVKGLGFDIDYQVLRDYFDNNSKLVRIFYYTAMIDSTEYHNPIQKLVDWLDYNGYTMVTKTAKEFTDGNGKKRIKGNMDIELAIDMLEIGFPSILDHVVLFSGDGDFRRLIEVVQRRGVRATVISTNRSNPPMASDDLRRQADVFIDLYDLQSTFERVHIDDDELENVE